MKNEKYYQAWYYRTNKETIMLKRRLRLVEKDCVHCGKPLDPLRINKSAKLHRECVYPYLRANGSGFFAGKFKLLSNSKPAQTTNRHY